MKSYINLFACIFVINAICAQKDLASNNETLVINTDDGLISRAAFSNAVSQDLNFLIFDKLTPQSGISATAKEDGTQIVLSGQLYSGNYGLLTAAADLSSTKGVYFFDQDKGGNDASISLNFFKGYNSKYVYNIKNDLGLIDINLQSVKLISDAKTKMDTIFSLLSQYIVIKNVTGRSISGSQTKEFDLDNILVKDDSSTTTDDYTKTKEFIALNDKLISLSQTYINSQDSEGFDNLPPGTFDIKPFTKKPENLTSTKINYTNAKGEAKVINIEYNTNLQALIKEYLKFKSYVYKQLEDEIIKNQLSSAASYWTSKHLFFFSAHPFYKRESFTTLNSRNLTFDEIQGDIFGITINLINYSYQNLDKSKKWYMPRSWFVRTGLTASRSSNRSDFRESNLSISQNVGTDSNGNMINATSTRNAFIGDAQYQYGNTLGLTFETYYYPANFPIGLFGSIGYSSLKFPKDSGIKNKEIAPLRLGLLAKIKNTDAKKDIVTLQLFLDRTDLSLAPNGGDKDLRFGIGLGVPINF